jgi:nicotinamide phosphoribosyltransferase
MSTPFKRKTSTPNRARLSPFELFAPHCLDSYKLGHRPQYPKGTEFIYSNFTARSDKHLKLPAKYQDHKYVIWGVTGAWKDIVALWDRTFFTKSKEECLTKYRTRVPAFTGKEAYVQHLADLHDLGYLPLRVKMIREGSRVNIGVPFMTIVNTLPDYFWLTNSLETHISNEMWKPMTAATIAYVYRRMLDEFAEKTGSPKDFVPWQGHDFADRGMSGMLDAAKTGGGHSLSFWGSDSVSAFDWLDFMYKGGETFMGGSVPATEHSVMTCGGTGGELETIRRVITEVEPEGVVSFVADTYDFWKVITEYAVALKDDILNRKFNSIGLSKVVFRPDSGDPADILCGTVEVKDLSDIEDPRKAAEGYKWLVQETVIGETDHGELGDQSKTIYFRHKGQVYEAVYGIEWNRHDKRYYYVDGCSLDKFGPANLTPQQKGAVECLWDIFGGDITDKGYKAVCQRVGLIYGDSITPERCLDILERLERKGFASCNVVFGIGSYTYQFITRDTLGMAIKGTFAVVDGEGIAMFKDPKTDSGMKKSAKGLVKVLKAQDNDGEKYILVDNVDWDEEDTGELETMFEDGNFLVEPNLAEARTRLLGV